MEIFIMIFIITILLDVYMMVNDKFFPYNQTIVDRINKIVGVVVWTFVLFIPIPHGMVEGMYALHAYLGNFRFVALLVLAFCAIAYEITNMDEVKQHMSEDERQEQVKTQTKEELQQFVTPTKGD